MNFFFILFISSDSIQLNNNKKICESIEVEPQQQQRDDV